ncbi:MAG: hypothetical protein H6823_23155 [Planctomycetaceae bacterium]|nr:hypothetical protein [Planctomycetales bacterium]MCB9941141.1 hypothetical protein [Planctomycetaceae bacterium]
MQPHLADGSRTSTSAIRIAERRIGERRWSNEFVVTRYVVVLNLGPVYRAELINESEGGIAIQVGELHRTTAVGRSIDVIYRGKRRAAEIWHFTANDQGFLVGLQWTEVYSP